MKTTSVALQDIKILDISEQRFHQSLGFAKDLPAEKQIDLLYCTALFASEGNNKNDDYLLRHYLIAERKTAIYKHVNFQHKSKPKEATEFKGEKIGICGHIYDSQLVLEKDGKQIFVTEDKILEEKKDGKTTYKLDYEDAESYRLHLLVAFVVYAFEFPDLAEEIKKTVAGTSKLNLSVSMEIMFSDYKLRVGNISPFELFEETKSGSEDYYCDSAMDKLLNNLRTSGKKYKDKPIVRVIGGEVFFSGMGIVFFPANQFSVLQSVEDTEEEIQRVCTPKTDKDGNVVMQCVLSAVASEQKKYMNSYEKMINEGKQEQINKLNIEGLIHVKGISEIADENCGCESSFSKILLLYHEGLAAKGVLFIIGFPKDGGGSEVQSVLFDKTKWTVEEARKWLKTHKFHSGKVDVTDKYIRFRQNDPGKYKRLRTIKASTEGLIDIFVDQLEQLSTEKETV